MSRSGSTMRLGGEAPEPVFASWAPSERVQGLTEDQIKDMRQRLNVTVQVADGQPPVPAPIESFQEMVSDSISVKLACAEQSNLTIFHGLPLEDLARQHKCRHHAPQVPAADPHSVPGHPNCLEWA